MKVLVAEDDRATRVRILACLAEWGHEGIPACDGAEAWEIFRNEGDIPLVITDWQMPEVDGVELIRRIRDDKKDVVYHYAILLTSRSEKSDIVAGIEAGADDFVGKPFDKDELRARINAGARVIRLEHELAAQNSKLEASNREIRKTNERMKKSLLSAASIQQSFLPPHEVDAGSARFCFHYQPCDELAGDTLNIVKLDEAHVAVYAIDVSGHGVPAALMSVHLSRILTRRRGPDAILFDGADGARKPAAPAQIAEQLNRRFTFDPVNQQYFTMMYGLVDLKAREFRYTSAGHPGPVLVSGGRAEILKPMPPAVGFIANASFSERTLKLSSGDRLLFYTDGIFEMANGEEEEFGEERLAETFLASSGDPLNEAVTKVVFAARKWGGGRNFDDDISVLATEIV